MKMKFLLITFFLFSITHSLVAVAQDEIFEEKQTYEVPESALESSEEIYIPAESDVTSEEPIILDESDSQAVEGASEYDY